MEHTYFSDRELGARPRVEHQIPPVVWGGIVATITSLVAYGSFGADFPEECGDGQGTIGTNEYSLRLVQQAEIPEISWPLDVRDNPSFLAILDLVEFCYQHVAKPGPIPDSFHKFYGHNHLRFDRRVGQLAFRERINRIFARNHLVNELQESGEVRRLAPPVLREEIASPIVRTGEQELDLMIESARIKYLDRDPQVRREALEKLWDAWERLKTIEPGHDKRASARAILDKAASESNFRQLLEDEAIALTQIGNKFQIRHSETSQRACRDGSFPGTAWLRNSRDCRRAGARDSPSDVMRCLL